MNELLTVDEVAALLRTTRKAIYTKVERGVLPGVVRDGKRLLFSSAVLRCYLGLTTALPPPYLGKLSQEAGSGFSKEP